MKPIFWLCPHCKQFHTDADAPETVTCDLCGLKFTTKIVEIDPEQVNVADFAQMLESVQ